MDSYYSEFFCRMIILILIFFIILELALLVTDILSLIVVKNTFGKRVRYEITLEHFKKIFGFTTISYLIGILSMFTIFIIMNGDFSIFTFLLVIYRLVFESISKPAAFFCFSIAILVSFLLNIVFNYFIVLKNISFSKIKRLLSSLIISIFTAPFLFYLSFEGILNI